MATNMAASRKKSLTDLSSAKSDDVSSQESAKEQIAHLLTNLESERKLTKQLRREKSYEVQQTRDLEQTKTTVALKDLRSKLHLEKTKELELQKENLSKKFDLDFQKVGRVKDTEISKLRGDLQKCQDELRDLREQNATTNKRGLSVTVARGAFDTERAKLLQDIQELRGTKKQLEDELRKATDSERQKSLEVQRVKDNTKSEVAKARREGETEIRKLERQVWQLEKEKGAQTNYSAATKRLIESLPSIDSQINGKPVENGTTPSKCQCQSPKSENGTEYIATEKGSPPGKDPGGAARLKVTELTAQVKKLEEQCNTLSQDKTSLQQRIKEMEKRQRGTHEKNKKFLEKNIEVTNINRSLEEKIKKLTDDLNKLKSQSEKTRRDQDRLSERLSTERLEKQSLEALQQEVDELRQNGEEQEKTVTALKMACLEKDRRIELLVHKRRKQKNSKAQQKAGGVKETYFGYDEDNGSLDSEMSGALSLSSTNLSLDTSNEEDEVFDEVTRDDIEQNFQRLVKEHLELEKSHALLQAKLGQSHLDPQRENKLRADLENDLLDAQSRIEDLEKIAGKQGQDTGWLEEKDTFNKTIRMLKDKVKSQEQHEQRLGHRIREEQEQNEELEFRILELEEANEKLKEEAQDTITINDPPTLSEDGTLHLLCEEKGHMEIHVDLLKEKLHDLKHSKDGRLDKGDKLVLLQARAMLGIADKKLKDLTANQTVLKEKIKTLEAEKAELLSAATGVSSDLILEHEETREKLVEAGNKIHELEEQVEIYKQQEAVHKYTEEHAGKTESRHKQEIAALQRQLSNSHEGREYESELWQENQDKIKTLERQLGELEKEKTELLEKMGTNHAEIKEQLLLSQEQCCHLQNELENSQQETNTLQSHLVDKQQIIDGLEVQVYTLAEENTEITKKSEELSTTNTELTRQLETLKAETPSDKEIKLLQDQVTEHDTFRKQLQTQIQELEVLCEKQQLRVGESEVKIQDLATANQNLQDECITIRDHNTELQKTNIRLHDEQSKLSTNITALNHELDALTSENTSLKHDLNTSRTETTALKHELDSSRKAQKDAENQVKQVASQNQALIDKIKALEIKVKDARETEVQTRDRLSLLEEEKSRRIEALQTQVDKMEENEQKLSETITDMEDVEKALREKLEDLENSQSSGDSNLHTFDSQAETLNTSYATESEPDRGESTEENARLRQRISELEARLDDSDLDVSGSSNAPSAVAMYREKIENLESKIQELASRESELMEDIYSMKLENQELQDHIDELMDEKADTIEEVGRSEGSTPQPAQKGAWVEEAFDDYKKKIADLEFENSDLKDQLLKAKLAAMDDSVRSDSDSEEKANRLDMEGKLKHDLEEKENANKYLEEKVKTLQNAEEKLMEEIQFLEENEQKLTAEIKKLRDLSISSECASDKQELESRVRQLEAKELELLDTIKEIESMNSSMKDKLSNYQNQSSENVTMLQKKVELLLDTEEKLVDRLKQQEEVELDLNNKIKKQKLEIEQYEKGLQELKTQLEYKEQVILDNNNKLENSFTVDDMKEIEDTQRVLKVRITELEKSESSLKANLTGLETTLRQKEKIESELNQKLDLIRSDKCELENKISEYVNSDSALRAKLDGLEAQKQDLLETIKNSTQKSINLSVDHVDTTHSLPSSICANESALTNQGANNTSQPTNQAAPTTESQNTSSFFNVTTTDIEDLDRMPKDEMISRIHELEQMEQFHIVKIKELSDNLTTFRQAVEVVAVTMETDAGIPLLNYKPKLRDTEFEARVQELIKSEVNLKLKNLELEKKEAILGSQLREAESTIKQQTREYRAELEDLEAELDRARKNEAKLKNKLQYGGWGQETQSLAKIQHLEDLVFELEATERRLKRQLQEAQDSEQDLKERLARAEQAVASHPILSGLKSLADQEKFYQLLTQVKLLECSEQDLKDKLSQLKDDTGFSLQHRVLDLERSEQGLKRKLDFLEAQEASMNFEEDHSPILLDSPEAILRQRIHELEKMEKHLKRQVVELEKDREELHEITRKDKSLIHELNVQIRELQLSEKSLKEQGNQLEASESTLHIRIDNLTDKIEDLESLVKKLQASERHLKAQLVKNEYTETNLNSQLENAVEDLQSTESKLKKKLAEMELEKTSLRAKIDELSERIGDLEGVELSLKQKLRTLENSEQILKERITELESSEKTATSRSAELEALNETLSHQLHAVKEEKSSLVYEMSDMDMLRTEHVEEVHKLKRSISSLEDTSKAQDKKKDELQRRLDEFTDKEVLLHSRLGEHEKQEKQLRDQMTALTAENKKLARKIMELEAELSISDDRLGKENSYLHGQMDDNIHSSRKQEDQIHALEEKLRFYENSATNGQMATIPKSELNDLRNKVTLVQELSENLSRAEKSEKHLQETISKLRQGKDACGHEIEKTELIKQNIKLNASVKAHEMLKMNHEDVKKEMRQLRQQISTGDAKVTVRPQTSSKNIQVKLAESYTIRHLAPEFKAALRNLGARYPEAYQDFVKTLQPSEGKRLSLVRVPEGNKASPATLPKPTVTPHQILKPHKMEDSGIAEDFILAQQQPPEEPIGTVSAQVLPDRAHLVEKLVSLLPMGDVDSRGEGSRDDEDSDSSLDETPVPGISPSKNTGMFPITNPSNHHKRHACSPVTENTITPLSKGGQKAPMTRPLEDPDPAHRKLLIDQLVNVMPDDTADNNDQDQQNSEAPLWKVVEEKDPQLKEKPYWTDVEGSNVDDMTLTLDIWGTTTTDESGSEAGGATRNPRMTSLNNMPHTRSTSSIDSDMSAPPPPLPSSLPPPSALRRSESPGNESYYLPSSHHEDDSADEASEIIDEDDGASPLRMFNGPRAKSLERDSDFSEGSFMASRAKRRSKAHVAGSLDSIPDSGMESLRQDDVIRSMKDRIKELETKLEITNTEVTDKGNKLKDSENQLAKLQAENKDKLSDLKRTELYLTDKERQVRLLKEEISNQEKIIKAKQILLDSQSNQESSANLRLQLDRKERELTAKTNEIDKLMKDVRKWQTDSASTQQEKSVVEKSLKRAEEQLQALQTLDKSHRQLQQTYNGLKSEHEQLEKQYLTLSQVNEDKKSLEGMVLKLRGQLKDYDRIELERHELEKKLKALEMELRNKANRENELTQQNAKMLHQIDTLQQNKDYYKNMEHDYKKVRANYDEMEKVKAKALTMITPLRAKVLRLANKCKSKDELIRRLASELHRSGEHSEVMSEAERILTHSASEEYHRPISPVTTQTLQAFEKELRSDGPSRLAPAVRKPEKLVSKNRRSRRGSTGSTGSDRSSGSDVDALLDHDMTPNRINGHSTDIYRSHSSDDLDGLLGDAKSSIDDFVLSPPHLALKPVTQLNNNHMKVAPSGEKMPLGARRMLGNLPESDTFKAIKDYDPSRFSTSGHPRLEIPLKEGDIVKVTGPKNAHGYYEAEVDGQIGLVPALYLQPVQTKQNSHKMQQQSSSHTNSSPEQILSLHQRLQNSHVPNLSTPNTFSPHPPENDTRNGAFSPRRSQPIHHPAFIKSPTNSPRSPPVLSALSPRSPRVASHPAFHRGILQLHNTQPANHSSGPPEPPTNFSIQRVVGDHSILLSWCPPVMDELARSNCIIVRGYKIYINGKDKQLIPSPHMTKALIEKLNLSQSLNFSIQSMGENGQMSRLVDTLYDEHAGSRSAGMGVLSDSDSIAAADTDYASLLSTAHADEGERRVFIAVYDYTPAENSPNNYPTEELSFKTGDIIITYGSVRGDGFYNAKVHSKRGLVPASFMEEVALLRCHGRRSTSSSTSLASNLFSSSTSANGSNRVSKATTPEQSRPTSSHSNRSQSNRAPMATV